MDLKIPGAAAKILGAKLKPYGVADYEWERGRDCEVDISGLEPTPLDDLEKLLCRKDLAGIRGIKMALHDIATLRESREGKDVKARSIKIAYEFLKVFLKNTTRQWVYERSNNGKWYAIYIYKVSFDSGGRDYPPSITIHGMAESLGLKESWGWTIHSHQCNGKTSQETLNAIGLYPETPTLRNGYQDDVERWKEVSDQIGKQFWVSGHCVSATQGESDSNWWHQPSSFKITPESRCVVDVNNETGKDAKGGRIDYDPHYWRDLGHPDIPVHPDVTVYVFRTSSRLVVHCGQLKEYVYDPKLGAKLILPSDIRQFVDLLVHGDAEFRDIVSGKSGGQIILCAGPPGTGKTLTAEVYSEVESRALYSVQCSQLGTKADDLEEELSKCFRRAQRWNAIMLLDEADVYVSKRGSSLTQNAIVGVFLRVMEYYGGVLFLTTNRGDLVDDAVASRCLARIDYAAPEPDGQEKIWRVLSDSAGVPIPDSEIRKIVKAHPGLSGRDVKNLLKLSIMVSRASGEKITAATVAYVKRFKPTNDLDK